MVTDVWAATVAVGLGLWWAASVVHQFHPSRWERVARHDRLRLLPAWHFFEPNPVRRDQHLVYRDVVDGRPGSWREVDMGADDHPARFLWNPTASGRRPSGISSTASS